jgi:hypothetical protein
MGMQMWIIEQKGEYTPESSRTLQEFVHEHGGFILMVTRTGPLVALEDSKAAVVEKHPLVAFMGPVQLNPHGIAARQLQQIFAENLAKQLTIEDSGDVEPTS